MSEINKLMFQSLQSKEKLSPRTLQNWDLFGNIYDNKPIFDEIKYK